MKTSKIWDGTDPGATPGRVFTASIGQELIIPEGGNLNYLKLGLKGAVSTAAVVVETFAPVLSEYVVRIGAETRIQMDGQDLVALMMAYFNQRPKIGENTDGTGNDFLGGVKVPIFAPVSNDKPITHAATRTAVTNISTETISVTGYWDKDGNGNKPVHAVKIALTTAAAAGYQELSARIAPVGTLKGLLVKQANDFADGNIDVSIQRLRIKANGVVHSAFNSLGDGSTLADIDYVTPSPIAGLLAPYAYFNLGPTGIDAKGQELTVEFDVEDVSDAVVFIPILDIV